MSQPLRPDSVLVSRGNLVCDRSIICSLATLTQMPLLQLWTSSPEVVGQFTVEQVVATAGDGALKDGSVCSQELRDFLPYVSTEALASYVDHCLLSSFPKSGLVLQDLVNELGRRLDYRVTPGRYQGSPTAIGFDGIWRSPEGHSVVVEVKTTDVYRISLDTLASYRRKLEESQQITSSSSILIVVGRQDTGELEAQVRGSRHAWDVRLISAEALLKVVRLKQTAESAETGEKIRNLLVPTEYTRLDGMIDVMFTAAREVEEGALESASVEQGSVAETVSIDPPRQRFQFTDATSLQRKRDQIVASVEKIHRVALFKRSRALHESGALFRIACTISKFYDGRSYPYWYAYHPQWDDYLRQAQIGILVLGCMNLDQAFCIPREVIETVLPDMNMSVRPDGAKYWHLHVVNSGTGYSLLLPKRSTSLSLTPYSIAI